DGKTLTVAGADAVARVFEVDPHAEKAPFVEAKELRNFELKSNTLSAAAFSKDGGLLVTGNDDGKVYLWDVKEGKPTADFTLDGGVRCVAVSAASRTVATTTGISGIQTWDLKGRKVASFGKGAYSVLVFNPHEKLASELAAGNFDNQFQLFWGDQRP